MKTLKKKINNKILEILGYKLDNLLVFKIKSPNKT